MTVSSIWLGETVEIKYFENNLLWKNETIFKAKKKNGNSLNKTFHHWKNLMKKQEKRNEFCSFFIICFFCGPILFPFFRFRQFSEIFSNNFFWEEENRRIRIFLIILFLLEVFISWWLVKCVSHTFKKRKTKSNSNQ